MRALFVASLVVVPMLALAGCQSCVADSSEPQDTPSTHPAPGTSLGRFRPRPMTPAGRIFLLRDAGAGDE